MEAGAGRMLERMLGSMKLYLLHGLGVLGIKLDVLNDGAGISPQIVWHAHALRVQPIQGHESDTTTLLSIHDGCQLCGNIISVHDNIEEAVACRSAPKRCLTPARTDSIFETRLPMRVQQDDAMV